MNHKKISVLAIDPSLRSTGLAIVTYEKDTETYTTHHCRVLVNPLKFKGTEAILNMLDMLNECTKTEEYMTADCVLVESPPASFGNKIPSSTIASIAHISGGAAMCFGADKCRLFRPTEWNSRRKKELTHENTEKILGECDSWHYVKKMKSEKLKEHILDAASMALWWIQGNYE